MSDLFSKDQKDYGDEYKNHLFEQYKLFIESVEKTSDRRQIIYWTFNNSICFSILAVDELSDGYVQGE